MFTGIIEDCGEITSVKKSGTGTVFSVRSRVITESLSIGDSVSVNGACQTVSGISGAEFDFFSSKITLSVTTLGLLNSGSIVNLERAMKADGRFDGHMVSGHVDGKGMIISAEKDSSGLSVNISSEKCIIEGIIPKGSICVDGISLTVVSADDDSFSLYIIPETLNRSNVKGWRSGYCVNIETDLIGKYVKKYFSGQSSKKKSIEELMKESGF